jgi:hypothetical protein
VALKGLTSESLIQIYAGSSGAGDCTRVYFPLSQSPVLGGIGVLRDVGMKNMLHVIIEASGGGGGLSEVAGRRRAHRMAVFLSVCGNRW